MGLRQVIACLVIGLLVALLTMWWSIKRRGQSSGPLRSVRGGGLLGLLVAVAALSGCEDRATADGDKIRVGEGKKDQLTDLAAQRKAVRARLLAGLKAETYERDERASGRMARAALAPLVAPLVAAKDLSAGAAERLLDLHEECVGHTLRSMATCYEPMPLDWLDWESGGGARRKACTRLALLDKLVGEGRLTAEAGVKARQEIASGLAFLDGLRTFLGLSEGAEKEALKKKLLAAKGVGTPDDSTREAAAYLLKLFSER